MKISGALPVHNEEKYLPYTLSHLLRCRLDELVFVLDRCNDGSEEIIDHFSDVAPFEVRKIHVERREWKYPTAEVFKIGFENAMHEVVYSLGADCLYHPEIFEVDWSNLDFASFPHIDYDPFGSLPKKVHAQWINFYKEIVYMLYPKLTGKQKFSGIFGFRKEMLNDIKFIDVMSEDIWFLKTAYSRGYRYRYFPEFVSMHIRPCTSTQDKSYLHGVSRAQLKYPFWKVVSHSILFNKPKTIVGYMQERFALRSFADKKLTEEQLRETDELLVNTT